MACLLLFTAWQQGHGDDAFGNRTLHIFFFDACDFGAIGKLTRQQRVSMVGPVVVLVLFLVSILEPGPEVGHALPQVLYRFALLGLQDLRHGRTFAANLRGDIGQRCEARGARRAEATTGGMLSLLHPLNALGCFVQAGDGLLYYVLIWGIGNCWLGCLWCRSHLRFDNWMRTGNALKRIDITIDPYLFVFTLRRHGNNRQRRKRRRRTGIRFLP